MDKKNLPFFCEDHPDAQIRHEWDRTRATVRLTGAQYEYNESETDQYFCNVCGRELSSGEVTDSEEKNPPVHGAP